METENSVCLIPTSVWERDCKDMTKIKSGLKNFPLLQEVCKGKDGYPDSKEVRKQLAVSTKACRAYCDVECPFPSPLEKFIKEKRFECFYGEMSNQCM